jgi:hypothetical protein
MESSADMRVVKLTMYYDSPDNTLKNTGGQS